MENEMSNLEKLCRFITENDYPRMREWQWGQGVCLYALERAFDKTNNPQYLEYIKNWVYSHLKEAEPGMSVNTTAAANGILALYKNTGDETYMPLCEKFAAYLMAECPRCDRGAFEHTCVANRCPNQVWVDTVFMGGIFLARYGVITGKRMYVNEALRQLVLHYDLLCDKETGLLYHGCYCDDRTQHGALWGRGNGWFSAAAAVILELTDNSYPMRAELERRFKEQLCSLIKYQRADGSFGTVINDCEAYSETTGTSGITFGISLAVRSGIIEEKYLENAKKAYEYLSGCIGEDGAMNEGSDGTCVNDDMAVYKNTRKSNSEFSQGLAIIAFTEC